MSKHAKPLSVGSTIGVMAPSSRIGRADLEAACGLLVSKGFKVAIHPQVVHYAGPEHSTQFTGTDEEKLKAFHDFVKDPNIHAILFATVGQRALRGDADAGKQGIDDVGRFAQRNAGRQIEGDRRRRKARLVADAEGSRARFPAGDRRKRNTPPIARMRQSAGASAAGARSRTQPEVTKSTSGSGASS